MKHLTTIGYNHAPAAYAGTIPPRPDLAHHDFVIEGGEMHHLVDGKLRASVPPAGLQDYIEIWPACEPVAREILAAEQSAAATLRLQDLSGTDAPGA